MPRGLGGLLAPLAWSGESPYGGLLSGLIEGEKLKREFKREDVEASLRQLQILREQMTLGAPQITSLGGNRLLVRQPSGSYAVQDLPAPPPTKLQEAQTDYLKAGTAWRNRQTVAPHETAAERAVLDWLAAQNPPLENTAQNRDKARVALEKRRVADRQPLPGPQLTPEAKQMWATVLADGGPLPNLGWGRDATAARFELGDMAAKILQQRGDKAGSLAVQQKILTANATALSRLSVQEAQLTPFARTARDSLRRALEIAEKRVKPGEVPVINRWLLNGRKSIGGDPDVAAFDYHLRAGIFETARVVSTATGGGGVVSDSARAEIDATIQRQFTIEQIRAVVEGQEFEINSRLSHLQQEKEDLINAMRRRPPSVYQPPKPLYPEPTPKATPKSGYGAGAKGGAQKIHVRRKSDNQTGTLDEKDFDASKYERVK